MQSLKNIKTKLTHFIAKFPLVFILAVVVLFIALIVLGKVLSPKPKLTDDQKQQPKSVQTYSIGKTPEVKFNATIDKTGLVTITSLTQGVVSNINVKEGEKVKKGKVLVNIGSNYAGANAAVLARQIAQKQASLAGKTFDIQKDVIFKQKELADKNRSNTEELRKISEKTIADTQATLDTNSTLLTEVDKLINAATPPTGAALTALLGQKVGVLSANAQLKSALEQTKYSTNKDNPPTKLADLSWEIVYKQLDIAYESAKIQSEIANLSLGISYIQESLTAPTAPFSGIVQRVYPKVGQAISPGSPILILSQVVEEDPATAIVYVPQAIAESVSRTTPSSVFIDNTPIYILPSYVTEEAVQGGLYAIYFPIPDSLVGRAKQGSTVEVVMPVGFMQTTAAMPFVPISAVNVTSQGSYLYVIGPKNTARAVNVTLGDVVGSYVTVTRGLKSEDLVILDPNIVDGDLVTASNNK